MSDNSGAKNANDDMAVSAEFKNKLTMHEKRVPGYYNDPTNNCTVGVGTLVHYGPCTEAELHKTVTHEEIDQNRDRGVTDAEKAVRRHVTKQKLNQKQFEGLVGFVYNAGPTGASHVMRLVNAGKFKSAVHVMNQYVKGTVRDIKGHPKVDKHGHKIKIVLPGLIKRRAEESAPFRAETAAQSK